MLAKKERPKAGGTKRTTRPPRRDRQDWIEEARRVLIADGIERVKVEPLAQLLGVTTGSFYHHFQNRDELLMELLADWEKRNTDPIFEAVEAAGTNPVDQIYDLFHIFIKESEYDPTYDTAVRAWAHTTKVVEDRVRSTDDRRIELLSRIFMGFGFDRDRAFIRARIAYFHQVGYQAMEVQESEEQRLELLPSYIEALVGIPLSPLMRHRQPT